MSDGDTTDDTVATRARRALAASGLSLREAARRLASRTGNKMESEKRKLERIFAGEHEPEHDTAEHLAAVLGGDPADYMGGRRSKSASQAELHRKLDEIMALLQELYELTAQPPARLAANPEWLRRRLRALEEKVDEQRKSTAEGLQEVRRTVDVLRASLQERQPPASEEPPQVEGQQ